MVFVTVDYEYFLDKILIYSLTKHAIIQLSNYVEV